MDYEPDGRFLIVSPRVMRDGLPMRAIKVVRGYELAAELADGWELVAEDPEPDRYAPWSRDTEDPN